MKGLRCPVCGSTRLKVTGTRPKPDGELRRRRVCEAGHRFSTAEIIITSNKVGSRWLSK